MRKLFLSTISVTIVLTCFSIHSDAQIKQLFEITLPDNEDDLRRIADNLIKQQNYKRAIPYYEKLDSLEEGERALYKFRIAQCYLRSHVNKRAAVDYLELIKEDKDKFGEDYYYFLGKAYHYDHQFANAIKMYSRFLEEATRRDNLRKKEVRRAIDQCANAQKLIQDTVDVTIENLGSTVNSPYIDYAPVISADESVLIFTSRRKGSKGGLQNVWGERDTLYGKYYDDIYVSINIGGEWRQPVSIGSKINSRVHESCISLSPDGQKLFVYRSDSVKWGNIFVSNRGVDWGKLWKMPRPINSDRWEGGASITDDGQTIYFASNRMGGVGKRDIYVCRKLPNGKWGKPKNLKTINTKFNEKAPFIHPDGRTLYFTSEGHNSMGGFDIFRTKLKDGEWTQPENLGYPINSADDDISFVLSADGERGYYTKTGENGSPDLFVVHMPTEVEELTLVKGRVAGGCYNRNIAADLEMLNLNTRDTVKTDQSNKATGKFLFVLQKGKRYVLNASAPKHLSYSDTIVTEEGTEYKEINLNINLKCEDAKQEASAKQEKEVKKVPKAFNNIHFEFDKATLNNNARDTLNQLVDFMKEYQNARIVIVGYTDAKGTTTYNKQLSKRRAETVKSYLIGRGVNANRIETRAQAAKNPIAPNKSEEGRAKNRRVEFQIID